MAFTPFPTHDIFKAYSLAREALSQGKNMIATLRETTDLPHARCVEIAYALQSGSYTATKDSDIARAYRAAVHDIVVPLCQSHHVETVFDCGTGEGNMWCDFPHKLSHFVGLDLSLHRLLWAARNLQDAPFNKTTLCKGDMASLPLSEHSFDLVVTMHALEPNARASDLIPALAARTRDLLVLFEPNYREASPAQRQRMEAMGYARDIWECAEALSDFEVLASAPLDVTIRADNQTYILILKRKTPLARTDFAWQNPLTHSPLLDVDGSLVDEEGCFFFPKFKDIFCLAPEDAVFAGLSPQSS
ncbi:class I SAM-dependent methyltransferase [Woodsholea maritima]|uniref:class I SAM-dependent methyltransferase n=1 Tax=Woodsholea maritima TaxID=240237 RepID=UPI0003724262|nr:class I SAM-dependent methyltransferase [Woodsholea maritima]